MKVLVGFLVLAILACASADCGCLKCNPSLQVVSPRYSPCKVIYRNNRNLPSIAPYKLQAAIPPPPPVFVPKEYDYQMQYLPYATPYVGSVYEYGLQAALPPPPPVHLPLKNLRTGVERVVMDAPFNSVVCGTSTCNNGVNKLPLPAPLPPLGLFRGGCGCGRSSCECNSDRYDSDIYGSDRCDSDVYRSDRSDSCGRDSCDNDDCNCDSCSRARVPLLRSQDYDVYRGPIIEPIHPSLCSRYAPILIPMYPHHLKRVKRNNPSLNCKKFRRKRDLSKRNLRNKRDVLDPAMNFMFKFVPNMLRGPIVHAINTIQHNANPAVARARATATQQRMKAHMARSKHKLNQHKIKNHHQDTNKKTKHATKTKNPFHIHPNIREDTVKTPNSGSKSAHRRNHQLQHGHTDEMIHSYVPMKQLLKSGKNENQENLILNHYLPASVTNRFDRGLIDEEHDLPSSYFLVKHPRLGSKYNIDRDKRNDITEDFVGRTNAFLKDIFSALTGKSRTRWEHSRSNHHRQKSLDEIRNHLHSKGYSNEDIRDILLTKMKKFNEIYEREKRSIFSSPSRYINDTKRALGIKLDDDQGSKTRSKRAVLLDTNQFQLPFFEIEDEILDNYYPENSEEETVGLKRNKKRKHRRHYDDSEMDSGEEILGASHPMHDHPFVVLLRTPLKLLHHFHDIRKNFQPILYSFPKILQSSRKYLKDFGKNLQTGVLDFASNIMGDFDNQVQKRYDSFLLPSRKRRSLTENIPKTDENKNVVHERDKRYILKVVDEKEVQEFLEEKLGGYFDDEEEGENQDEKEEESEERVGKPRASKETGEKKFVVKKLSPKLILDNNGKPFIEINGNKRPLFFGKNKNKSPLLQKAKQKTHKAPTPSPEEIEEENEKSEETKHEEINDKIDEVIAQAKKKLRNGEILKSVNCDEIPTQTVKEKINQISSYIQDLVSLDCSKYADLYENLSKLEKMKKSISEYWKKVMINEKTNDIQCKIKILKYIREMQNEKDKATEKIAKHLKEGDNFIVKKLIKLLVRLQKLQCLIQKIVDHFDNRMKIGTVSDTEKEIKFVDFLSSLSFDSSETEEEFVSSLKKEKHDSLHREIQFLENLRILLQKDDSYITNEVAKQIWEMRNIEKLQQEAIEEMNTKLQDNMKIRKELKILFDLLNQTEACEDACEKFLVKVGDNNFVGSQFMLNGKRQTRRPNLSDILKKIRENSKATLALRKHSKKT